MGVNDVGGGGIFPTLCVRVLSSFYYGLEGYCHHGQGGRVAARLA